MKSVKKIVFACVGLICFIFTAPGCKHVKVMYCKMGRVICYEFKSTLKYMVMETYAKHRVWKYQDIF